MDELLGHLSRASVPLLALGVVLHLVGQALRGLAWRGALAPLVDDDGPPVRRRDAVASWLAGAGLSGVLSPRGGDAVRIALIRRALPGVPIAALVGTIAVEGAFETVTGIALGAWAAGRGAESAGGGIPWLPIIVSGVVITALAMIPRVNRWIMARLREAAAGVALLTNPRLYARTVLPYDVASRLLRFGSMACFLAAFALPTTLAAVAFLVTAQGSGRFVPAPGAAAGVGGTLLVVAWASVTGVDADRGALVALALGVPALLTAVGVTLSVGLTLWMLRTVSPRRAWRTLRGREPVAPAAVRA